MVTGLGVTIEKSVEVDGGSELTEKFLQVKLFVIPLEVQSLLPGRAAPCEEPQPEEVREAQGAQQGGQEDDQDPCLVNCDATLL